MRDDPSQEPQNAATRATPGPIIRVPVFVGLTLVGVLFDLLLGRAALLTLGDSIPQETRSLWLRMSTFGFNLATLSASVALMVMVSRIARRGEAVPLVGRLSLAIFGGVFLATLTLALTEEPSVQLQRQLMLGRAGGYMLMSLLAVVGLRARHRGMQLGLTLWAAMVFSSLAVLVLEIGQAPRLAGQIKVANEALWLLIPVAFGPAFGAFDARGRYRTLAFGLVVMVALAVWRWVLDEDFTPVFFGVFQLDALRHAVALYVPILGIVAGVSLSAATSRDAGQRVGGVALLLLIGAGHLPRSVGMMVVQALSLALTVWHALGRRAFGRTVSGSAGEVPL